MKKRKKLFFAKHAKSSAMLVSLIVHALIILVAISYVAITVIIKEEKTFVAKKTERPKMKLKKLQVPIKMEKRKKQTTKLSRRAVVKNPRRRTSDISVPEVSGVVSGIGAMDLSGGIGADIGFTMPEIDFFKVKKKSEKMVLIALAGSATTRGQNRFQSPKSRMCFYAIRARLNDLVSKLPEFALFNAAFFDQAITTPFSTNMLLATEANKQKLYDWGSTVNDLYLEETYGPMDRYEGFWDRFKAMDWYEGDIMTNDVPPCLPKWVYHYSPGPHLTKYYRTGGDEDPPDEMEWTHFARAMCFAFEQKPDAIFLLTTNYPRGQDPGVLIQSFGDICRDLYGLDRRKWPTFNVAVLVRPGRELDGSQGATTVLDRYSTIISAFRGRGEIIQDIRRLMTEEERDMLDGLPGTF